MNSPAVKLLYFAADSALRTTRHKRWRKSEKIYSCRENGCVRSKPVPYSSCANRKNAAKFGTTSKAWIPKNVAIAMVQVSNAK